MPTARKRGDSWRVQVFSHKDENGKRIYQSFTARSKHDAEQMAVEFNKKKAQQRAQRKRITVPVAVSDYINSKSNLLSPATIRGYRQMEHYFQPLAHVDVHRLSQKVLQGFINDLADDVSQKTVRNAYGLLTASCKLAGVKWDYNITLPPKEPPKGSAPTDADVKKLFAAADGDMRLIVTLAAFGLRRGEICALKYGDVTPAGISVHADMVEDANNKFHLKDMPKTYASIRVVRVPDSVIEMIGIGPADEFIIKRTPNAVTHGFVRLRKSIGVDVRLHDLRHYYASVAAVLGVPDVYTADFGGWRRGSGTLKQVYQGRQDDAAVRFSDMISDHLENVMQPRDATTDE